MLHPSDILDAEFHSRIFDAASALGPRADELGNNILPAIPELVHVFDSPRVTGALASLLGPGYMMHPHRFCHRSVPGRQAQTWHRDSFWGNWHPRSEVPYWVMAFYYPQDTPLELGPTGILPRSQYYNRDCGKATGTLFGCGRYADKDLVDGVPAEAWHVKEKPLSCSAGTVVIVHYDLWHRGAANLAESGVRFMFKFQFSRLISPSLAPRSWNCRNSEPNWERFFAEGPADPARTSADGDAGGGDGGGAAAVDADRALEAVLTQAGAQRVSQISRGKLVGLAVRSMLQAGTLAKAAATVAVEAAVKRRLAAEHGRFAKVRLVPVWQGIWERLCGGSVSVGSQGADRDDDGSNCGLSCLLLRGDEHEPIRVGTAWALGRRVAGDAQRAAAFVGALDTATSLQHRAVMQTLEAAGPAVIRALLTSASVQRSPLAVRALGRALDLDSTATCMSRKPLVGDRVVYTNGMAFTADDDKWELAAGDCAAVEDVDGDGDFKLKNPEGQVTKMWVLRKYWSYNAAQALSTDLVTEALELLGTLCGAEMETFAVGKGVRVRDREYEAWEGTAEKSSEWKFREEKEDADMRSCAAEALGCLRQPESAWALLRVAAKDPEGDVRATACHGVLRLLQAGVLDGQLEIILARLTALQQSDRDRYVVAYAAEGAHRAQSRLWCDEQATTLVRWCKFGDGWVSRGATPTGRMRRP